MFVKKMKSRNSKSLIATYVPKFRTDAATFYHARYIRPAEMLTENKENAKVRNIFSAWLPSERVCWVFGTQKVQNIGTHHSSIVLSVVTLLERFDILKTARCVRKYQDFPCKSKEEVTVVWLFIFLCSLKSGKPLCEDSVRLSNCGSFHR